MSRTRRRSIWAVGLLMGALRVVAPSGASFSSAATNTSNGFSAASSFYRAAVLSSSPVAYWRLGESSGTTAATEVGVSSGTYAGGYTLGRPGALAWDSNTSVEFNGTSARVQVAHSSTVNLTTHVSIEAWVKPDTVNGTRYILHKATFYYLYILNNRTVFGIRSGGVYVWVESTGLVTTGSWQHVVGTYDGANFILYRNGSEAARFSFAGPIDPSTGALFIGAFDAASSFFDGVLDEIALYDRPLSAAEVQAHYARGV
jgi:concanavalin A-like lectin/glucanase superfamily protein